MESDVDENGMTAMYPITETSTQQIFAVVGSTYVSEHHGDEMHRYLPKLEGEGAFEEILGKLRSALFRRDPKAR